MPPSNLSVEFDKEEEQPIHVRKFACTVVSLVPLPIEEDKPGILPSTFKIEAAEKGDFSILHVEEGIHYIPHVFDNTSIKQTTTPQEMARSIVEDYASSHIGIGEFAGPGIFWVEGRLTKLEVKKHHAKKLAAAELRQTNWFHNLIAMADADWQRNKNMLAVSDLQRAAARCLGIQKDWLVATKAEETISCPFCKTAIAPDSIKCFNCKEVVNQKKYEEMTKGVK